MHDFNNEQVRKHVEQQRKTLLDEAYTAIISKNPDAAKFYSEAAHLHLMRHGWEIIIPEPKENWPSIFQNLEYDPQLPWPHMSTYAYVMNILTPPNIGWLNIAFGYAVVGNKLIKTTFFLHQKMVDYQIMPQGIAIDPLALERGYKPDFYIGCTVCSEEYLHLLLKMRKHPFEEYVIKEGWKLREV